MTSLFDNIPPSLEERFWKYHIANPAIYRAFCRFAQQAVDAGREYLGAKMIFERIRWYTSVEAKGADLKLNNNYHAFYARLWMQEHPEREDFFKTRKQTSL